MDMLFGRRDDFAIEAGIDGSSSVSPTVWGHMCIWCRGAALGDLDDRLCAIGIARDRFRPLMTPDGGRLRIDCLWAEGFADLDSNAVLNFLDRMLFAHDDDGECLLDKSMDQINCDHAAWGDFGFLANWGEQFDGYKSFLVRPPGDSVRILSRKFPASMGRAVDVSRDMFVEAVTAFCAWFDEIQREQIRKYELAVSQWRPPPEGEPWFPEAALAYLRAACFKETAFPCLELTSKSLFWSDEAYLEFVAICNDRGSPWGLVPLCFRSSLIRDEPDELARAAWEELRRLCPQWPGFRPERCSPTLREELERQVARA
ncbi:MAG: hypothetical protein ACKO50_01990 [Cyanobium sp.]